MIFYLTILCLSLIFETQSTDIASAYREFHIDVLKSSKKSKSYDSFFESLKKENVEERAKKLPAFVDNDLHIKEICTQIGKHIDAKFSQSRHWNSPHLNTDIARCEFSYPNVRNILNFFLYDSEYPAFVGVHHVKNAKKVISHPIRVVYITEIGDLGDVNFDGIEWEEDSAKTLDDLIFYNPVEKKVHFESQYGILADMKKMRKTLNSFPKDNAVLFNITYTASFLTDLLTEEREKEIAKTQKKLKVYNHDFLTMSLNTKMRMALYMGAILSHESIAEDQFLFPTTGIAIKLFGSHTAYDTYRYLKYFVKNENANPFFVYCLDKLESRLSGGQLETIKGVYPKDSYFWELKYKTAGPIQKLNLDWYPLKEGLKKKLMR